MRPFLQPVFGVLRRLVHAPSSSRPPRPAHETAGRLQPGIEVHRPDRRLHRVGQHVRQLPHPCPRLARADRERLGEPGRSAISASTRLGDQMASRRPSSPSCSPGKRSISHSATIRPSTRSPMNSSRSFELAAPPAPLVWSAERWVSASRSSSGRAKLWPSSASAPGRSSVLVAHAHRSADAVKQPAPADFERPCPDLPHGACASMGEEDELRPADQVFQRHEADAAVHEPAVARLLSRLSPIANTWPGGHPEFLRVVRRSPSSPFRIGCCRPSAASPDRLRRDGLPSSSADVIAHQLPRHRLCR